MKTSNRTSRLLSAVLRHKPEIIGISLDKNGWTDVSILIEKIEGLDFEQLQTIVATNEKQRFSFNEDFTKIRANQGHSIDVDVQLRKVVPPYYLFHGTSWETMNQIEMHGIKRMSRNHVHLSEDEQTAANVGARKGSTISIITVRAKEMHENGLDFYLSENGVWLTDHVPAKYINFFKKLR